MPQDKRRGYDLILPPGGREDTADRIPLYVEEPIYEESDVGRTPEAQRTLGTMPPPPGDESMVERIPLPRGGEDDPTQFWIPTPSRPLGVRLGEAPPEPRADDVRDTLKPVPTEAQRLGPYEMLYELAVGGMATVYLARRDRRLYALKIIHPHLARDRGFVEMFLDEAKIASRIQHPNVCPVVDWGEDGQRRYIAMEYLFGEPLSRLMERARLRPELQDAPVLKTVAAAIVADVCDGLHAAHEMTAEDGRPLDIVHRDISPHNIFVTIDGRVSVVDFGVATARDRMHETKTGQVKGKWSYMAPEQLRLKGVDRRADVWSLGVVLWEVLAGRPLFKRRTVLETAQAMLSEVVPPPSQFLHQTKSALDAIVLRAVRRRREERYATAAMMAHALRDFLASQGPFGRDEIAAWLREVSPDVENRRFLLELA